MKRATLFEEHSSVLPHWFAAGVSGATLVYLDAHLDLQFVAQARIERLRRCTSAQELRQWESGHPFSPDRSGCFGIENFLYPASRLGLIGRLVWVAPAHVLRVGLGTAVQALQQMEGVTLEQLESFHRTAGGWIEGRLLGLDMVMCELAQLPRLALGPQVLLDIDTDYFVSVPDDTVWMQPRVAVQALQTLAGGVNELTITRSVGSGFLPLRHRFVADLLAALWERRMHDADHWQRLLELDWLYQRGAHEQARAGLAREQASWPDCAATSYALGLASAEPLVRAHQLARAAEREPAYADHLLRRLGEFRARWKRVDLAAVERLHRQLDAQGEGDLQRASSWTALGLLYADLGRLQLALACDMQARRAGSDHPDLALALAKLHMTAGSFAAADGLLKRAAADDSSRVAVWLYQAECAWAQGSPGAAIDLASRAHWAAPAWTELAGRLAVYARAANDAPQALVWQERQAHIQRRLEQLVARLC